MNKVELFHHHFCVQFDMWYKRLVVNESHITKRITYSSEPLKLEWGYGKLWCNMDWYVCCGMECGTLCDVE